MKTEGQVRHKLKQVLYRHLKQRVSDNFSRHPETCRYNLCPHLLDGSDADAAGVFPRVCAHPEHTGLVCDSSYQGHNQAKDCELWSSLRTKAEVQQDFLNLKGSTRGEVAQEMPDAAALMWVLEADSLIDDPEVPPPPVVGPTLKPWWKFWA